MFNTATDFLTEAFHFNISIMMDSYHYAFRKNYFSERSKIFSSGYWNLKNNSRSNGKKFNFETNSSMYNAKSAALTGMKLAAFPFLMTGVFDLTIL